MLRLEVDPKVLSAMKKAFPKPSTSAAKALRKYMGALNDLLSEAIQIGNDPYGLRFQLFSISLHQLANKGGQLGPQKVRTHAWLEKNQLALVKTIERGNNLTGLKSRIRLTNLVKLVDDHSLISVQEKYGEDLRDFLENSPSKEAAWILSLYPGLDSLSEDQVHSKYHITEVDIDSLGQFIQWLSTKACHFTRQRKESIFRQAVFIYRVARFSKGLFLQIPKLSHFGRTYYEGISVQNIHRSLRQAMLGNCWEYDMVSAVVAWKLSFGDAYRRQTGRSATVERLFPTLLTYIEDKDDLIRTIRADTYTNQSRANNDTQRKQVKSALTALSFGARIGTSGWHDDSGTWQMPAIGMILTDPLERKRFVESASTKAFLNEQRKLDQFIFQSHLTVIPALRIDPKLQSNSGRPNRAKVLAYLYQHAETAAMNIFRDELAKTMKCVLANIHDAIIVRDQLSADLRECIVRVIREKTGNPYWRVDQKQIKRFEGLGERAA
jgi:hypothetical protein